MFDDGGVVLVGPDDRHDVEATWLFEEAVMLEELEGGEGESPLFLGGDGLGGDALPARLDLDEDQGIAVAGDQVDLAARRAIAAQDDPHPLTAQGAGRLTLAAIAEQAAQECTHDRVQSTDAQAFFN